MKKFGIMLMMSLCLLSAQAGEYAYLVFTNTGGSTTALSVTNMTLSVSGSNLVVTNQEGTVSFALTDLAAMQFSTDDTLTTLTNVLDADKPVQVFSLTGISLGRFGSLIEAAQTLQSGAYVITDGTNSCKIQIENGK